VLDTGAVCWIRVLCVGYGCCVSGTGAVREVQTLCIGYETCQVRQQAFLVGKLSQLAHLTGLAYTTPRTSIFPVTAPVISAVRYSLSLPMAAWIFAVWW